MVLNLLVCPKLHWSTHSTNFLLSDALLLPPQAEGVELMWLMLQNKRQSRYGALKLLDFAATRYTPPCEKLVDLVRAGSFHPASGQLQACFSPVPTHFCSISMPLSNLLCRIHILFVSALPCAYRVA